MRRILFLCTGNSARSILGEALINELGEGAYQAFSAGSHPTGRISPGAVEKLEAEGIATAGLESKSWDRFSGTTAPAIDIVITVCDNAAGESCPLWNGSPVTAHWGIPDPAYFDDEEARRAAFDLAYARLRRRVEGLVSLSPDLSGSDLKRALQQVHESAKNRDLDPL